MSANTRYGLEQARIQLPAIVANAHAGVASIITRHGKPYAAVVPVQDFQKLHAVDMPPTYWHCAGQAVGCGVPMWGKPLPNGETSGVMRK